MDRRLARLLDTCPDREALVGGGRRLSWAQLAAQVASVQGWLRAQGVRRGDRVGIHLPKCVEEVVATLAIAGLGAVWVNVHTSWTSRQLRFVRDDCQLSVLITDPRRARALDAEGGRGSIRAVLVTAEEPAPLGCASWASLEPARWAPGEVDPRALATLLYTSGSTGPPKGVMLGQGHLLDGARIVSGYLGTGPDDRLLGLLPLCFDYGLNQLMCTLWVGATLVLQPVPLPAEVLRTVLTEGVTTLAAVPPAWIPIVRLLEERPVALPSLRTVTNSGGALPRPILDALPRVFPGVDVVLMYGLTEAFRSSWLPPSRFQEKKGAIGIPIPEQELYVVDGDRVCGPGEVGELVHRGNLVSFGYWGRPEETAARIRPCPALRALAGDEPVVYSGDLVRRDEDGVLWFVGRADAQIKSSGFRVSPTEVEDAVFASGLVGEVVAWGVDDAERGQVIHLAVTAKGADDSAPPPDLELRRWLRRHLAHYLVPARVWWLPGPLPRTASGKLDRLAARRASEGQDQGAEREAQDAGHHQRAGQGGEHGGQPR